MIRLHLVGLTTDLKNLIFADQRGARSGGFVVSLDARLRRTLDEVARLEDEPELEEPRSGHTAPSEAGRRPERPAATRAEHEEVPAGTDQADAEADEFDPPPPRPRVESNLTPKEIQSQLRRGKTEEEVARLAGTDVDWVQRFSFAILAERAGVIDAVQSARLSKPRLGASAQPIGEAVQLNIEGKRLSMSPGDIDAAWRAVRTNGLWHVSFEYVSRGQEKVAEFSFDPTSRTVEPLNDVAMEIGWRSDQPAKSAGPKATASTPKVVSGVSARTARTANASRKTAAKGKKRAGTTGSPRTSERRPQAGAIRPAPEREFEPRMPPPPPPAAAPANHSPGLGSRMDVGGGEEDDEFIIRKPRGNPGEYSSLPKVWKPRRRP